MDTEKLNKERGRELSKRYKQIVLLKAKILSDIKKLIGLCCDVAPFYEDVKDENRLRMGWWVGRYAPSVELKVLKVFSSIATRTKNRDSVESWQLRLLGILTSVHHKDKPQAAKRPKRRVKHKSWLYHTGKTQDELQKLLKQVGGVGALTESERESIRVQFGPLMDIVRKL